MNFKPVEPTNKSFLIRLAKIIFRRTTLLTIIFFLVSLFVREMAALELSDDILKFQEEIRFEQNYNFIYYFSYILLGGDKYVLRINILLILIFILLFLKEKKHLDTKILLLTLGGFVLIGSVLEFKFYNDTKQEKIKIENCLYVLCLNNGNCIETNCECSENYDGELCHVDVNRQSNYLILKNKIDQTEIDLNSSIVRSYYLNPLDRLLNEYKSQILAIKEVDNQNLNKYYSQFAKDLIVDEIEIRNLIKDFNIEEVRKHTEQKTNKKCNLFMDLCQIHIKKSSLNQKIDFIKDYEIFQDKIKND